MLQRIIESLHGLVTCSFNKCVKKKKKKVTDLLVLWSKENAVFSFVFILYESPSAVVCRSKILKQTNAE